MMLVVRIHGAHLSVRPLTSPLTYRLTRSTAPVVMIAKSTVTSTTFIALTVGTMFTITATVVVATGAATAAGVDAAVVVGDAPVIAILIATGIAV